MSSQQFIAPSGYVELDNDCDFSLDRKSTRSRESVDPKTDLAFYFNTYVVPKYGLNNINVNNVASFMKDLEMNWTKIPPDMKEKVMDIMVDNILNNDGQFRSDLLDKLKISAVQPAKEPVLNKSSFGSSVSTQNIVIAVVVIVILYFIFNGSKPKAVFFGRLS